MKTEEQSGAAITGSRELSGLESHTPIEMSNAYNLISLGKSKPY